MACVFEYDLILPTKEIKDKFKRISNIFDDDISICNDQGVKINCYNFRKVIKIGNETVPLYLKVGSANANIEEYKGTFGNLLKTCNVPDKNLSLEDNFKKYTSENMKIYSSNPVDKSHKTYNNTIDPNLIKILNDSKKTVYFTGAYNINIKCIDNILTKNISVIKDDDIKILEEIKKNEAYKNITKYGSRGILIYMVKFLKKMEYEYIVVDPAPRPTIEDLDLIKEYVEKIKKNPINKETLSDEFINKLHLKLVTRYTENGFNALLCPSPLQGMSMVSNGIFTNSEIINQSDGGKYVVYAKIDDILSNLGLSGITSYFSVLSDQVKINQNLEKKEIYKNKNFSDDLVFSITDMQKIIPEKKFYKKYLKYKAKYLALKKLV
jgi:hypothetical protein